ncbi:MAG: YbdK family carboxylate-amine ligase [Candidatus Kuenenia sp.]|nr:YbdK family carboxylate-amine ligase [Candidatus Kuenenia hertensis]
MENFRQNKFPTLGIEEEFHLINAETADLSPSVTDVIKCLDGEMKKRVCQELLMCVIENRTGVFTTVNDLVKSTEEGRSVLSECCGKLDLNLVASGSHPFANWRNLTFVEDDHYRWVRENYGYFTQRLLSFGLHIHVGVKNEEVAIYVMNEMYRWIYSLLAFSANSPYYDGIDTGLASARAHLFHSMPRTRVAPPFKSYAEYVSYYEKLHQLGAVTRTGDLLWIIRPQPLFGTVEFRIFDLPTSVRRIGAFVALIQAAVDTYQDSFFAGKPASTIHVGYLEQNWWSAVRFGMNASMIEPATGEIISVRDHLKKFIDLVTPRAIKLYSKNHIDYARAMIEDGNEADQQRILFKQHEGDLQLLELEIARKTVEY